MSSAKRLQLVQVTVSEEFASVLKALAFELDWDQFDQASDFVDALSDLGIDEASINFNEDTAQFERS